MDNDQKDFSPQQSLQLIQSMIETTKTSFSDSSHYFLLWGWATMFGCIVQYVLLSIEYPRHYNAWLITLVALIFHVVFIMREDKNRKVKTFIGDATTYVWTIIGTAFIAFAIVFSKIGWQHCFPFYILLYSIGTYITGSLIKFLPMRIGGLICMILVAVTPFLAYRYQILLTGFAILISYIIPGHLLRSKYKNYQKHLHE